jgi:hypothetical protein
MNLHVHLPAHELEAKAREDRVRALLAAVISGADEHVPLKPVHEMQVSFRKIRGAYGLSLTNGGVGIVPLMP